MNLVLFTCVSILGFFCLLNVLWPLLSRSSEESEPNQSLRKLMRLYHEKNRLLLNLEDLESDMKEGKIAESDASHLKIRVMGQMGEVYKQIEEIERGDPFLEYVRKSLGEISR